MATIVYKDAVALLNGADLTMQLHELNVDYKAEMLDQTTFGDDTRVRRGGLYLGSMMGKGFFDNAVNLDSVLFAPVGSGLDDTFNQAFETSVQQEDTLMVVFPEGITAGSQTSGAGFAMKGVVEKFDLGTGVGTLLDIDFSVQSRGIFA